MEGRERERRMRKPSPREEHAVVLDYLPNGYALSDTPSYRKRAIGQAIGVDYFTLLEVSPKQGLSFSIGERIYVGSEDRDKVEVIVGRIPLSKLTATARAEIELFLEERIKSDEGRFVEFFNRAGPLSMRMHSIELIPGIGKKVMWEIIEERDRVEPFKSFEDMYARIDKLPDLAKGIKKRILDELDGKDKHKLFTK